MQNPEFGTANATHEAEAKIESLQEEIRQAEVSMLYDLVRYSYSLVNLTTFLGVTLINWRLQAILKRFW